MMSPPVSSCDDAAARVRLQQPPYDLVMFERHRNELSQTRPSLPALQACGGKIHFGHELALSHLNAVVACAFMSMCQIELRHCSTLALFMRLEALARPTQPPMQPPFVGPHVAHAQDVCAHVGCDRFICLGCSPVISMQDMRKEAKAFASTPAPEQPPLQKASHK